MNQNDPYKTPVSPVDDNSEVVHDIGFSAPRHVSFLRGLEWYLEGFQLFIKSPGKWIALTVIFVAMLTLVSLIPLPNELFTLGNLLDTFLLAGLMLGLYTLDKSGQFNLECIVVAFKHPLRMQLLVIGVLSMLIYGMLSYVLLNEAMQDFKTVTQAADNTEAQTSIKEMMSVTRDFYLAVFKASLMSIPIMAVFWFTAPLIVLSRLQALAAMKFSMLGVLYNLPAFILYILAGMVLAVLATVLLGLGWFVLFPVFVASQYIAWKDIFTRTVSSD